jgi:hypothetical protein
LLSDLVKGSKLSRRRRLSFFSFFLALLTAIPSMSISIAGLKGTAANSLVMSVGTGTYLAAAVTSTGAVNPLAAYSVTNGNNTNPQSFFIKNFGTNALIGASFSATSAKGVVTFTRCPVGTTFSTATTCSDSSTAISTAQGSFSVSFSAGQFVPMRAIPSKNGDTITINVTLSSAQEPAATNTVS